MAEWRKRAKIQDDVVYFQNVPEAEAQNYHEVFVWDVDKTYLDTKFESLRGLWRVATEKADKKRNVPGAAELVRCLASHAKSDLGLQRFPIYFITASPPQLEQRIVQKLAIDAVEPFGIFCKDNLENLRPRRLWRITKHVGYKLQALMQLRSALRPDVRMILFGDDGESDSIIYSLFSDICSRRRDSSDLRGLLAHFSVLDSQMDQIFRLQESIPSFDPVEKIYINLAEDTDAEYYLKFGFRVVPTVNAFQAALDLFQDQRLAAKHVPQVARRLINYYGFTAEEIERTFDDFVRRGRLAEETCAALESLLKEQGLLLSDYRPSLPPRKITERAGSTVRQFEGGFEPWIVDRIEYTKEYR
jgi:hypothetical protein